MTAISYHETLKDLQGLNWRADGPFARVEWFELLLNSDVKPLIALAKEHEKAVALPLCWKQDGLEILTNWYAFTWQEMRTEAISDNALLEAIARDVARYAPQIVLSKVPSEDSTLARLTRAFRKAGWWVFEEHCDVNHYLQVAGRSYADYFATRPGQLRSTIKRKGKLVDISLSKDYSSADWATYEAIYAESWKPEEGDPDILRRFAQQEAQAGRLRFGIARHNGEAVAAQFWTVENGIAHIHKLAHRESAKSLSAGTSLTAALFEEVLDRDQVREVDFGTGDDLYKRDWMDSIRHRYSLICLRPGEWANWPRIAKLAVRKLVTMAGSG